MKRLFLLIIAVATFFTVFVFAGCNGGTEKPSGEGTVPFTPSEPKNYTVSVVVGQDGYGTVSASSVAEVPYGTVITISGNSVTINGTTVTATAARATAQYTYAFSSWTNGTATVEGNMTITANFIRTVNEYTVSVVVGQDGYGTVSASSVAEVPYGTVITTSGNTIKINGTTITATAARATAQYTYAFSSWTNGTATVEGNMTITANFIRTVNEYTVSIVVGQDGYGTVSASSVAKVPYGTVITTSGNSVTINGTTVTATAESATEDYSYVFSGWDIDSATVEGNMSITANFAKRYGEYIISGKIDGEKFGLKSSDITASASNGETVMINQDCTYSVLSKKGSLTLNFVTDNLGSIEDTFNVSGATVKNYTLNEPKLSIYTTSFNKTEDAENCYKVNIDNGVPYNTAVYEWVNTKYFVIESDVSITNTGSSGDFGVGFVVGGSHLSSQYYAPYVGVNCGILISRDWEGVWKVEMIYFDENGTEKRDKVNADFDSYNYMHPSWRIEAEADISSDIYTATNGGSMHLKAVRADKIIALFINDKYVGSFMTEQYEGQKIAGTDSADYIGLYERGSVECLFSAVTFDLRESVAENAIAAAVPKNCTDMTMQSWNGFALTDGKTTVYDGKLENVVSATAIANNSGIVATAFTNVNSKYWILEATISGVDTRNEWGCFYIGFLVNGWRTSCLNMCYVPGENCFCLEGVSGRPSWKYAFVPDENYTRAVNLKDKYTELINGGSLTYKILRANDDFYIFIDGELVASASIAQLGVDEGELLHPSSHAIGFTGRAFSIATFSNISYCTDGLAVYNELKAINK